MVMLSSIFIAGTGLTEVVAESGGSETVMEFYYGIIVVLMVIVFIIYFFTAIFQAIMDFYLSMLEKKGRKDKSVLGMKF